MHYVIILLALAGLCLQIKGQNAVVYKVNYRVQVHENHSAGSTFFVHRNKKIIIRFYDTECDCFHVLYKDTYGTVLTQNWLDDAFWYPRTKNDHTDTALNAYANRFLIENIAKVPVIQPVSEKENARRMKFIEQYGHTDGINIAAGKLWLGMTTRMALDSWGIPYQIKRTSGNFHISEKWIYSGAYLFFENGVLIEVFKFPKK